MEQYSRRFIEELEKHIDPTIIEFFEKKRNGELMSAGVKREGIP